MQEHQIKIYQDGIWVSEPREIAIIKQFTDVILKNNFIPIEQNNNNFGYPYIYQRNNSKLHCRFIDSVFLEDAEAWTRPSPSAIITDNIPLRPVAGELLSVVPEFWHIWKFDPVYQSRPATWAYNCFMNRARGDRSRVFYELLRRNILTQGLVSYNINVAEYEQQYINNELQKYTVEHNIGKNLIPHNNLTNTLEQCIIDSCVSLILETYTSDNHVVFSEKLFRCLQMPRPWLLYCSPGSVNYLRVHGFDVLDDYVDHEYDNVAVHAHRLAMVLDQLETFINKQFNDQDYLRFEQAAKHNRSLLDKFTLAWPIKFMEILNRIKEL